MPSDDPNAVTALMDPTASAPVAEASGGDPMRPFRIDAKPKSVVRRAALRASKPMLERVLRFHALNGIYADASKLDDGRDFAERVLEVMGVGVVCDARRLEQIPKEGPIVVVANHPFGGVEGLILTALLRKVRPDTKLIANSLLGMMPSLRDAFFLVDPFGGKGAVQRNIASMKSAMKWVQDGHVLGVFPSGEVSHLTLRSRRVEDPQWNPSVGRIVKRTGATVVPIYFHGRNSNAFQIAGLLQPKLRTVMLPTEMLRQRKRSVRLIVGEPVPFKRLAPMEDTVRLTDYLRVRTYMLRPLRVRKEQAPPDMSRYAPIADAADPLRLERELNRLPGRQKMLENGSIDAWIIHAGQCPTVLHEIGRLREVAFRQVGEGSGKSVDLDRFDGYYKQLVLWDREAKQVVGGYRIGLTDVILKRYGLDGLYTHTLFDFNHKLMNQLGPCMELGRSFVHPDHQKSFAPLMLLWQGLGTYIVRHPRYAQVLGPVSISAEYSSLSRYMLWAFLKTNAYMPGLSKLLKPRKPLRVKRPSGYNARQFSSVVQEVEEVSQLVREVEADGKAMPVLLRQYLKLDGKLLGFNVDPEFGNVVDGLIVVDLRTGNRRALTKYLGQEGYPSFLKFHGLE